VDINCFNFQLLIAKQKPNPWAWVTHNTENNLNNWTACYFFEHSSLSQVKKSGFFFSVLVVGKGPCFCCVFVSFPDKGILDSIAHRPIIQVFTVRYDNYNRIDCLFIHSASTQ